MKKSCCFTGHRNIIVTPELELTLHNKIQELIMLGVTDFYAGGAVGWDMLCEKNVLSLREIFPHIRLNLILPCNEIFQTSSWSENLKKSYSEILRKADSVEYISYEYFKGCMKKRNQKLVDYSDYCICYYNPKKYISGTGQTVRMAQMKNIPVFNNYPSIV